MMACGPLLIDCASKGHVVNMLPPCPLLFAREEMTRGYDDIGTKTGSANAS